ncbi:hypothetical protein NLJ89_g3889 [Agrocybe chaxingu]|uniref:Uncharacterized protein n=1 Tax=Agrocybe chaxingu TaxID=84603 RepID=A0A9W8K3X3_9AGAR|nr:hypothetical protein NLJ89_g3889 [Agrocybe chaxingu]
MSTTKPGLKAFIGYTVDMPYLRNFLTEPGDIEISNRLAIMLVRSLFQDQLPLGSSKGDYAKPIMMAPTEVPEDNYVVLQTRRETVYSIEDVDKKFKELEIDRAKCGKFIEALNDMQDREFDKSKLQFVVEEVVGSK